MQYDIEKWMSNTMNDKIKKNKKNWPPPVGGATNIS